MTLIPRNRQRRMNELLDRAEIDVDFVDVRLGDDLLGELEGDFAAVEAEVETGRRGRDLDAIEVVEV